MYPIKYLFSTQPLTWILGLFKEVMSKHYYVKFDEAHIGYIKNDFAIDYLPTIKDIWKLVFNFSAASRFFFIPKLCFPLLKYNKKQIIEKLRSYDKNILDLCWTCKKPKIIKSQCKDNSIEVFIEACEVCHSCKNLKETNGILFDNIKKYKAVFNYKLFRDNFNIKLRKIITNANIECIHPKNISLKHANKNQ